jgi:small subunit ribosomal protein S9
MKTRIKKIIKKPAEKSRKARKESGKKEKETKRKSAAKKVSEKEAKREIKKEKRREATGKKAGREEKEVKKKAVKPERYFEAVGRRKTSVARVRLFTQGEKEILVNEKLYQNYFPTLETQKIILAPFEKMRILDRFRVSIKVRGGGIHSQAEAVRHGVSRALLKFNPNFRKKLKKAGFLTRDPRMRERKKFGLKRARRARQWRKR